ncbi:MAG: leucine--tRNA ligase [Candidatus Pacebacteria bacterium]|nr:leucine--tRNA ligase [Candidatus Paceibacterota bacterium]
MENYNPQKIEEKWRKIWEAKKVFQADLKEAKNPYYNLMMFPYPSAEGLHVGNVYAFTGSDIHGRFRRHQGFDVFEPIGFDAFGIHSENFAIKKGIHPKILVKKNVDNFRHQLKNLGCLFDWGHEVNTTDPKYYKWTQWLFLQLYKAGLACRKKAPVDWCPSCKTVLADEQVINGKCERCDSQVIQKETEQWFLKITNYAEKLLKNLEHLSEGALGSKIKITPEMAKAGIDWSEKTKFSQKNWIGKSEGALIKFKIKKEPYEEKKGSSEIEVFTTRPDTLFGCTYLVLAPEHPVIKEFKTKILNLKNVEKYIEETRKESETDRLNEEKEKVGVELKGIKVINPVNQREIPVWIADYVLVHYGTGAVMAVPCHDQRDFDFAKAYNLPMIEVISSYQKEPLPKKVSQVVSNGTFEKAYEGDGVLINSGRFDGMNSKEAQEKIVEWLNKKDQSAKKSVCYKLRDWLISRQRYWGAPIPMIYCEKCGWQPVPEKDLPVLLPYTKNFRPKGTGVSPLDSIESFVKAKCPKCKGNAKRETDVCDTFMDSSWYFIRYPSTNFNNKAFDNEITKKWLPVDMYIGGHEHAVLHLMYSRFITMALKDMGLIDFEEPFKKFRAHGLLTKEGAKMSKSKGNVVNPDDYYKKFGTDTLRTYLMFLGPFEQGGDWQDLGINGVKRFLEKIWLLSGEIKNKSGGENDILLNQTIKKVTEDLENLRYNTAISALMILVNHLSENKDQLTVKSFKTLLLLLSPFAPHLTEELWQKINYPGAKLSAYLSGNSIHSRPWPEYNPKLIKEKTATLIIQVNGKIRDKIEVNVNISKEEAEALAISREKVKNWVAGKEIKKVIFVPEKLINIVI